MSRFSKSPCAVCIALLFLGAPITAQSAPLVDYFPVIEAAIAADPLLKAQQQQVKALQLRSVANEQLDNPAVSLSMANVPIDGLSFHQEAMTQVKMSVSQRLPRGDSLKIGSDIFRLKATNEQLKSQSRELELQRDVGNHWLNLHFAHTSKYYVQQSRDLISELVTVTQSQYSVGKGKLQDVVKAQVEQSRLSLKISKIDGTIAVLQAGFTQWLPNRPVTTISRANKLPPLNIRQSVNSLGQAKIQQRLLLHPQLQLAQQGITLSDKKTELAKQAYEPAYTLQGSYGLRAEDQKGVSRADLFSIGIKLELPLFASDKQDNAVEAAVLQSGAKSLEKSLLLRKMLAMYNTYQAELERLQQQFLIYQDRLLAQLKEQSESTLSAYNNDSGDFAEVMRAYIDQMNGFIEFARLKTELLKQANRINFLFPQPPHYPSNKGVTQ